MELYSIQVQYRDAAVALDLTTKRKYDEARAMEEAMGSLREEAGALASERDKLADERDRLASELSRPSEGQAP